MPPRSKTASSTPRLSEYARRFVYPVGIRRTVWPRVEAKGRELGLGFDWWQAQLGTVVLGYGDDGKYCATVGGVGLSIPRQVGKTYFVLALLVIMCILFPGLQVLWTSHHMRTTNKTLKAVQGMSRRAKIAPHVRTVRTANGEGQVEFVNGSIIMFGARAQGFGRGMDEVDVEVFDEAQILDTKSLEDMIAATNQARHEHGALLFYMGTPPRPGDPSDAFIGRRRKAINGKAPNAVWLEIGADPKSNVNDRSQWPKMNPSFPKRTPAESLERLRENLEDDDSWNREGRGVWDEDDAGWEILGSSDWTNAKRKPRALTGTAVAWLAVAATPDLSAAAIAAACVLDGEVWVRVLAHGPGVSWVAEHAKRLQDVHRSPVVLDKGGPCSSLIEPLTAAAVTIAQVNGGDVCDAAAAFVTAVTETKTLRHMGDPELDTAMRIAIWRNVNDRRAFGRKVGDISPLEAASLAAAHAVANNYDIADSVL